MFANNVAVSTQIENLHKQLEYHKNCDILTGLNNRQIFYDKVSKRLNTDGKKIMLCVDIEKFSFINSIYGIKIGDKILCSIASDLQRKFMEPEYILGRMAGDVFAIFTNADNQEKVIETVFMIFTALPVPMEVTPAIGICPSDKSTTVNFLYDGAVMALRSIKKNYFKHVAYFNNATRKKMQEAQELLSDSSKALANGEFKLYFQPKCNMNNGEIVGAEILVRWEHPQKGIISPGKFIPLFEESGFIERLDTYIWEKAVQWLRSRIDNDKTIIPVSVNISRIDVIDIDVYKILTGLVEKYDINPELLELEITESIYVDKSEQIINLSAKLMDYGFNVLIDDFGSGYSSLNILKDIKANILKIDMRFLESGSKKGRDIIESVVHMGQWLDMVIIPEGVEKQEQVDFLRKIGCIYAQGFFYYRPMEDKVFEELIDFSPPIDGSK